MWKAWVRGYVYTGGMCVESLGTRLNVALCELCHLVHTETQEHALVSHCELEESRLTAAIHTHMQQVHTSIGCLTLTYP